jgi:hypothetical protein
VEDVQLRYGYQSAISLSISLKTAFSYVVSSCYDANNDFGFRRNQEEEATCPFQVKIEGVPNPCDVCEFPLDGEVTELCALMINAHCFDQFQSGKKVEEAACLEHLDLVLGSQCVYGGIRPDILEALTIGVTEGRDGKGVIYLFSSGNDYANGEDAGQEGGYANTRFTINVGSVGQDGLFAYYSTSGESPISHSVDGTVSLPTVSHLS